MQVVSNVEGNVVWTFVRKLKFLWNLNFQVIYQTFCIKCKYERFQKKQS